MIFNATQHRATPDQVKVGVIEQPHPIVRQLITFDSIEDTKRMVSRATEIARIITASGCNTAMVGGAPYFMGVLEGVLKANEITPLYSFTKRKVEETHNEDGTVSKSYVFKHEGFIER